MANELAEISSASLVSMAEELRPSLPKDFIVERAARDVITLFNDNPALAKYPRAKVKLGIQKAWRLGLSFSDKECYLITYGNDVQFQTDYKGEKKFVKRYSVRPIKDIYAKVVREGDFFEDNIIDNKHYITFKPKPFSNAPIVGVFAYVEYEDGAVMTELMSTDEVNAVRNNYSKQKSGGMWTKSWDQAALKTVIRRLCKHIDIDFETAEMRNTWNETSDMEFENGNMKRTRHDEVKDAFSEGTTVDIEATVVEEADEVFGA